MFYPTSNLVSVAYIASIGLGGAFIGKKIGQAYIWFLNQCVSEKIDQKAEKTIIKMWEFTGGFIFAFLAAREIFSENSVPKQIKILSGDLHNLEKEVSNLFKIIYNNGMNAIRNFELEI